MKEDGNSRKQGQVFNKTKVSIKIQPRVLNRIINCNSFQYEYHTNIIGLINLIRKFSCKSCTVLNIVFGKSNNVNSKFVKESLSHSFLSHSTHIKNSTTFQEEFLVTKAYPLYKNFWKLCQLIVFQVLRRNITECFPCDSASQQFLLCKKCIISFHAVRDSPLLSRANIRFSHAMMLFSQ